MRDALVVEPDKILQAWLATASMVVGAVASVEACDARWLCRDAFGVLLAQADAVCLAAGFATLALLPDVGLRPIRGQAEFTRAPVFTGSAAAWGPYAIPMRDGGVLFGASHLRGDASDGVSLHERAANLEALRGRRPALAGRIGVLAPGELQSRAGVRASTPDHLPIAGEAGARGSGLYVLSGLGGRGFTLAPLLAEHLAALAVQAPSPVSVALAHRLRPERFASNPATVRPLG